MKHVAATLLMLLAAAQAQAHGFLRAQGHDIVDERGDKVLLRGMGLGGWMLQEGYMLQVGNLGQQHVIRTKIEELIGPEKTAEFYEAWRANHVTKQDIDAMASWGFNSIRLPMHYNLFTPPVEEEPVAGEITWRETGFAMTDRLLEWSRANGMYVILDLHAAPGGQGNDLAISDRDPSKPSLWESETNRQKTIALWRKLAERYRDEPWIGAYNLINEPNWGFASADDRNGCQEQGNGPLRQLMVDITSAIREVDTRHMIVIEGNCWGNNYKGVMPLWDDNLVISFHKYWNENSPGAIDGHLKLRGQHNAPLWLGESGENSNVWFRDAIHLVEGQGIGWAFWPLKKLGFNNPLEIRPNPGYLALVEYWHGRAGKPSTEAAYDALMQLAREDIRFENNIRHPDVIDAMLRQPHSDATQPFKPHRITASGGNIAAVDYDIGRNGYAYFDTDVANYHVSAGGERKLWNHGRTYRNDGVDIGFDEKTKTYHVSHMQTGEWLAYTLQAEVAGPYSLSLLVASQSDGGRITVSVNHGAPVALDVPSTGDERRWLPVVVNDVELASGNNRILLQVEQGGYLLSTLRFEPVARASAGVSTSGAAERWWNLVWSDEFDGDGIDPAKWELEANCWGGGNAEQQCYTARTDRDAGANAFVDAGLLTILARRETFSGPDSPEGTGDSIATLPYTSARLRTRHRQEWTFGRFEIRAKLPRGQGTWPAIWMLPTGSPHGRWAASGEIDIMEAVNLGAPSDEPGAPAGTPERRVHGTLHYGRVPPGNVHTGTFFHLPDGKSPADDFHVYALEWEEDEIRWYVDGIHYATQRASGWYSQREVDSEWVDAPPAAPFDRQSKFHLLLNLAVGGNWAGKVNATGIDERVFPQAMLVDYVRVYRCGVASDDGAGCATIGDSPKFVVPDESKMRPVL